MHTHILAWFTANNLQYSQISKYCGISYRKNPIITALITYDGIVR